MDQMDQCEQVRRPKHDIVEGDVFVIRSDGYGGKAIPDRRQPAECSIAFDFTDRLLSLSVLEWRCDENFTEPFLSVYRNCDGLRKKQLVGR